MTTVSKEYRNYYYDYDEAQADFDSRILDILDAGYLLRSAALDYDVDFDTKLGKWKVWIRWFPHDIGRNIPKY